jgi:epoxide hydrolase-like predicted phosphatase
VEEAELRARVRLDPHLAPGRSTESATTHGRYLRYLLEHLAVTDEAEIDAIARWRRGYNLPVGLWNRADPEALAAVRRVRAAGLVAGVISNSNGSVRSILEETGLAAHLHFILDSSVVGVEKPDPRIFELACEALGIAPPEAVMLDDIGANLKTARALGMATIRVGDPDAALGKLEELLGFPLR